MNDQLKMGYEPSLDGIRAFSVIAVMLYHADIAWLPGGFLGVEIFFVVSGFLITSLLIEERESTQRINLKQFWIRRARRLLPLLFVWRSTPPTQHQIFVVTCCLRLAISQTGGKSLP
jgi:peptidoglycan/LPS O-acetylase OafA/YrhL